MQVWFHQSAQLQYQHVGFQLVLMGSKKLNIAYIAISFFNLDLAQTEVTSKRYPEIS